MIIFETIRDCFTKKPEQKSQNYAKKVDSPNNVATQFEKNQKPFRKNKQDSQIKKEQNQNMIIQFPQQNIQRINTRYQNKVNFTYNPFPKDPITMQKRPQLSNQVLPPAAAPNFKPPQVLLATKYSENTKQSSTYKNPEAPKAREAPLPPMAHAEPLNDKFENTVKDSEIGDNCQQYQYTNQLDLIANGLPNVGNTCYLNSVLQMLFSGQKFRKMIVKLSANPSLTFHKLIANVFQDITNKQSMEKKKKHLLELVYFIEKTNPQFARFQQNDAIQCLLNLLNMLEEEDSTNSKLNYFKIKYQPHCKCTNNGQNILLENYYVNSQEFCITCKQKIQFKILNSAPYLIVMPNAKNPNFKVKPKIKFINKDNNEILFENKCFVTHFGTQNSGHYISHRKIQEEWIEISDSSVYSVKLQQVKKIPIITMYGFKQRKLIK